MYTFVYYQPGPHSTKLSKTKYCNEFRYSLYRFTSLQMSDTSSNLNIYVEALIRRIPCVAAHNAQT